MPFYEEGAVRIHYEEAGTGFPLLLIPGGGLNSNISYLTGFPPFNIFAELQSEYRCITLDLRNATGGESSGPLEIDRPWDSYTDDQLGPHGPSRHRHIPRHGLLHRWALHLEPSAPGVGSRRGRQSWPSQAGSGRRCRRCSTTTTWLGWGPSLCARQPGITTAMVEAFLTKMYRTNADFVFTVTRDFVRTCQTPLLILPDDVPSHPYAVAVESAQLAPKAEVSLYPWKETPDQIAQALDHIRRFLRRHRPL